MKKIHFREKTKVNFSFFSLWIVGLFMNILDYTPSSSFDLNFILKVIKRFSSVMVENILQVHIFAIIKFFLMQGRYQKIWICSCSQKNLKHLKISISLFLQ